MSALATCFWFDRDAEEAARFYVSLIPHSRIDAVFPYASDGPGGSAGGPMLVEFTLGGQRFQALNGGPQFPFTPAASIAVTCADQPEVDRLWDALCEGGSPGRCGWLTDRYGVSWQIVPRALGEMLQSGDRTASRRVTQALLAMTKLDGDALRAAFEGTAAA